MIPKACALGIILAFSCLLLSEMGFRGKKVFALLSSVVILISIASELDGIFTEASSLLDDAGVGEAAKAALKVVGLGYVFGISSDIVEQLGETGISKSLTLLARVEIFGITFPYVRKIIELGISLIK